MDTTEISIRLLGVIDNMDKIKATNPLLRSISNVEHQKNTSYTLRSRNMRDEEYNEMQKKLI